MRYSPSSMKYSFLLLTVWMIACTSSNNNPEVKYYAHPEKYRPQYHFSPDHNWTNDPNGLVYYNGAFHIFYQYNPYGIRWGHMSWGHATSPDLVHWSHQPVAITEYTDAAGDSVMIFSGSAVVDQDNTSGFFQRGTGGIVTIYTSHVHKGGEQLRQHQSIAYSTRDANTYERFAGNPVLDIQRKDFRDPKVFWYEPTKKWIMIAVIPDEFKTHLYESSNLKEWKFLSEFGPLGDTAKIWECPDLIQVPSEEDGQPSKWVLIVSNSHPQGPDYVGMQYFVGDFDGTRFTPDDPSRYPIYLDYGKDYYAGVTFNNIPGEGNQVLFGWANNWAYGQDIPTNPWRGAMAMPRMLSLYQTPEGTRLRQRPVVGIQQLKSGALLDEEPLNTRSFVIEAVITPSSGDYIAGVSLFKSGDEETVIGYDASKGEVFFDRTHSGNVSFHPKFSSIERAPARLVDGKVKLSIYVDQSIVEVFINDGEAVITDQIFPTSESTLVQRVERQGTGLATWTVFAMRSSWDESVAN